MTERDCIQHEYGAIGFSLLCTTDSSPCGGDRGRETKESDLVPPGFTHLTCSLDKNKQAS